MELINFTNLNEITKSIFLMILAVSGGFVAQTLGCKTQKLLIENMYVKHILIIMLVFFTSGIFGQDKNPNENVKITLLIYVIYLLFTKMNIYFTLLVFTMFCINYILSTYVEYYEKNGIEEELVSQFKNIQEKITIASFVFIILGFSLYFNEKYSEFGKDFSLTKFIFGIVKCDSLK
jgi:FtsH-binding integral membrane protein